jgi:hypothetical protein
MAPTSLNAYRLSWVRQIADIPSAAWDRLARPNAVPFLEWNWLRLMESSGSATPDRGWMPLHLTVWSDDRLVAAAPLYVKGNSTGEFVFDHVWVDVAERLGVPYYPKLIGMSPFTPASGYRFLVDDGEDEGQLTRLMVQAIEDFCRSQGLSGCSFHYVDPGWRKLMEAQGFRPWLHQSFSWFNQSYRCFDDFLARFKANQRRNIRRERKAMADQGISMAAFHGDQIPEAFFPLMYRLYSKTNDQFGIWGCKYLTPDFFDQLYDHFRQRLLFTAAFNGDHRDLPVAMAMLLTKRDRLYGRYWGTVKEANALHFNTCYYQPIEWAIERGVRQFDPGIGGFHKIRRGFEAVPNFSLHRFFDPRLQQIMDNHIHQINAHEIQGIDAINQKIPFSSRTASDG